MSLKRRKFGRRIAKSEMSKAMDRIESDIITLAEHNTPGQETHCKMIRIIVKKLREEMNFVYYQRDMPRRTDDTNRAAEGNQVQDQVHERMDRS